jgi:hypothetical protein
MELRFPWFLVDFASLMLLLFLLFIFDLLVRGSPHHYVSVWPFGFIYKAGRKPDSRKSLLSGVVASFLDCVIAMIGAGAVDYCRHAVHSSTNQAQYLQ